ncbi:MAG: hypothetical protein WAW92_04800 [Minisyncoccia bacterium]
MQVLNITQSYSRKINHAIYGGNQFESSDHFVSLSAEVETGEDIVEVSDQLKKACELIVSRSIEDEISKMEGGISAKEFEDEMYNLVAGRGMDSNKYNSMSQRQKSYIQIIKRADKIKKT